MTNIADIIVQIIKGNIKKYLLFLACNIGAIAMVTSLFGLSKNVSFTSMDSIISSNIYAPMYVLILFMCFFIPYTQLLLQKQIIRDYGILESLGMSTKEVGACFLSENIIICIVSLIMGCFVGKIFEFILIVVLNLFVNVNLSFEFKINSFGSIIIFVAILYGITIVFGFLKGKKENIYNKLIEDRNSEEDEDSRLLFGLGIIMVITGIGIFFVLYKCTSNIAFLSMILIALGQLLIIDNSKFIIQKMRNKDIFWASDWLYYYKRNRNITFWVSILYFFIIFMLMMGMVTYPNFANNARKYNPFDISFTAYSSLKWAPDINYMNQIAKGENTQIKTKIETEYINIGAYSIFDIEDINKNLGTKYECSDDEYIYVYCVVENDGYEHDINATPKSIELDKNKLSVNSAICDVLYGNGCGCHDDILLVSHREYLNLSNDHDKEKLYAFNYNDTGKSINIYNRLKDDIISKNDWVNDTPDISCKELSMNMARQSSTLLIILLLYDSLIILFSIYITIRYKFGIEYDNDKKRIELLVSLGEEHKDIQNMIKKKIKSSYCIPFVISCVDAVLFSYGVNYTYGYGKTGIVSVSIIIIILFAVVTILIYALYHKNIKLYSKF